MKGQPYRPNQSEITSYTYCKPKSIQLSFSGDSETETVVVEKSPSRHTVSESSGRSTDGCSHSRSRGTGRCSTSTNRRLRNRSVGTAKSSTYCSIRDDPCLVEGNRNRHRHRDEGDKDTARRACVPKCLVQTQLHRRLIEGSFQISRILDLTTKIHLLKLRPPLHSLETNVAKVTI